uniref:Uncharacterized protein n=1 Tax=Setaria viridis TaxID=4556 RepID=A0A4U6VHV5_SETVI|nr:hypothetical protein SEVIR_3G270900v2 [Setaria viridis]
MNAKLSQLTRKSFMLVPNYSSLQVKLCKCSDTLLHLHPLPPDRTKLLTGPSTYHVRQQTTSSDHKYKSIYICPKLIFFTFDYIYLDFYIDR